MSAHNIQYLLHALLHTVLHAIVTMYVHNACMVILYSMVHVCVHSKIVYNVKVTPSVHNVHSLQLLPSHHKLAVFHKLYYLLSAM